ncbi:hypothetical protein C8Q80DRAFT_1118268 [Daedaleopsis nitida]|nr:hypothetical protein C8Q80DRAFT_1118268 [Daedaleopsis nitida]
MFHESEAQVSKEEEEEEDFGEGEYKLEAGKSEHVLNIYLSLIPATLSYTSISHFPMFAQRPTYQSWKGEDKELIWWLVVSKTCYIPASDKIQSQAREIWVYIFDQQFNRFFSDPQWVFSSSVQLNILGGCSPRASSYHHFKPSPILEGQVGAGTVPSDAQCRDDLQDVEIDKLERVPVDTSNQEETYPVVPAQVLPPKPEKCEECMADGICCGPTGCTTWLCYNCSKANKPDCLWQKDMVNLRYNSAPPTLGHSLAESISLGLYPPDSAWCPPIVVEKEAQA